MATATPEGAPPALPLEEWEQTKDTLHPYSQVVGKVRLASTWPRNHCSATARRSRSWTGPRLMDTR